MKKFALAVALACALSGSALAGDAFSVGAPAPPPPGDAHSVGTPELAPGEIPSVNSTSAGDMGNGGLSVILSILDLMF